MKWTSLTPLASVACGIGAGIGAMIVAVFAWLKIRMLLLKRDVAAPDAFQRISQYPHVKELLEAQAADERALGIDAENKALAERAAEELTRRVDELEHSPEYQASGAAAREAMIKKLVEAHYAEMSREVEAAGRRNAERIAALRELRELEQAMQHDRKPTPEERFRMNQLREKAFEPER